MRYIKLHGAYEIGNLNEQTQTVIAVGDLSAIGQKVDVNINEDVILDCANGLYLRFHSSEWANIKVVPKPSVENIGEEFQESDY